MDYISKKDSTIGHRMKKIRSSAHLTQEQLADILGVSVNYLGEVERGRKPLSLSLAEPFCKFFHITFDYLYDGIDGRSHNTIREHSVYRPLRRAQKDQHQDSLREQLQIQLSDCTTEELIILSHLIHAFLDSSRSLNAEPIQQNHDDRQDHTDPEYNPANLS